MPTFSYQAIDVDGHEVTGSIEAGGLGAAVDKIRMLGLFPGSVKKDSAEADGPLRFFHMRAGLRFGKKSRQARIVLFTRELADLLASGVPLPLSLRILYDRQKSGKLKNVLRELALDVEAGVALSEALEKHKNLLGDISPQIARAGERSGRLAEALEMLADLNQRRLAQARTKRKAFTRPTNILVVGFLLFLYQYVVMLPVLVIMFPYPPYGRHSPWFVKSTLDFIAFFKGYFWLFMGFAVLIALSAKPLLRLTAIRAIRDAVLFRLPPFRRLSRIIAATQLARPLCMFLSLGASFPDALRSARPSANNLSAAKAVNQIASSIEDGGNIADAMEKSRLFHPTIVKMLDMV